MTKSPQRRAIDNYRVRLSERGMSRFEVIGRDDDRDLIRAVARRLAESGEASQRLRSAVVNAVSGDPPKTGGILNALRSSPLVGIELDLTRSRAAGRKVRL